MIYFLSRKKKHFFRESKIGHEHLCHSQHLDLTSKDVISWDDIIAHLFSRCHRIRKLMQYSKYVGARCSVGNDSSITGWRSLFGCGYDRAFHPTFQDVDLHRLKVMCGAAPRRLNGWSVANLTESRRHAVSTTETPADPPLKQDEVEREMGHRKLEAGQRWRNSEDFNGDHLWDT